MLLQSTSTVEVLCNTTCATNHSNGRPATASSSAYRSTPHRAQLADVGRARTHPCARFEGADAGHDIRVGARLAPCGDAVTSVLARMCSSLCAKSCQLIPAPTCKSPAIAQCAPKVCARPKFSGCAQDALRVGSAHKRRCNAQAFAHALTTARNTVGGSPPGASAAIKTRTPRAPSCFYTLVPLRRGARS